MSRSNDIAGLTTSILDGVTKAEVGLGNVDNTADSAKPVSTAQQTALDAKLATTTAASTYAPLASPTFTGNVNLASNASGTFNGTIGASATLAEGGLFKCIKNYHALPTNNPGEYIGTSSNPWTKKSGLSQSWADVGSDFTIHGNEDLQFPVTGIWQITMYVYFYKQAANMGRNMEFVPHIYNGTSWYGLDYIRVGENYGHNVDGEGGYTRGGGAKTVMINVTGTDWRIRIRNNATFSSNNISTGGEITFLCLSNT